MSVWRIISDCPNQPNLPNQLKTHIAFSMFPILDTNLCIVCQRNYCKMLITQTNSTYGRDHNWAKTFMKSDLNIFETYHFTRFISLSSYGHTNTNPKSQGFFVIGHWMSWAWQFIQKPLLFTRIMKIYWNLENEKLQCNFMNIFTSLCALLHTFENS